MTITLISEFIREHPEWFGSWLTQVKTLLLIGHVDWSRQPVKQNEDWLLFEGCEWTALIA